MFGMKKVLMCMNNLNSQMQMLNTGFEAVVSGIKVLGEKIEAVEARLDRVEARLDSMDEKIDMVEYHLGKEIQVTYQTALENKRGIETLSRHFDGEICKITELSGRFDEFQRKCVGA